MLTASLLVLAAFAQSALADVVIGEPGTGAGQYKEAQAVAFDAANERLYVSDRGNNRVDVFDSANAFVEAFGWGVLTGANELQTCTTTCRAGLSGSGSGQFNGMSQIVADNDPLSMSYGDVYVADRENNRIEKVGPEGEPIFVLGGRVDKTTGGDICTKSSGDECGAGDSVRGQGHFPEVRGLAIASDGSLYVEEDELVREGVPVGEFTANEYARHIQELDSAGVETGEIVLTEATLGNAVGIAVDSAGDVYVGSSGAAGGVSKYDISGRLLFTVDSPSFNINALAVDSEGRLFLSDNTDGSAILEYEPTGAEILAIYGSLSGQVLSLASGRAGSRAIYAVQRGRILVSERGENGVLAVPFPPPGPVVSEANSTQTPTVGNLKATVRALVSPEGKATTYHFQYIDQEGFESGGFANPSVASTRESSSIGADFSLHAANAQLTGLVPSTIYHYRVVATNEDGTTDGPEGTFQTLPASEVSASWATRVGVDSAALYASVNPLGIEATGYFQYVDDATYRESGFANAVNVPDVPHGASPIDLGEGEAEKSISVQLFPLSSATVYHYRVLVNDSFGTTAGPERTFTTFPGASSAESCPNQAFRTGSAGGLPDCRAYEMVTPVDKENGDIVTLFDLIGDHAGFSQSSASGEKLTYSTYRAFGDATSSPYNSQYLATRAAGAGWSTHDITPPGEGPLLSANLGLTNEFKAFSSDLSSGWLTTATEPVLASGGIAGFGNLYRRDNVSEAYEALTTVRPPHRSGSTYQIELQGVSGDGRCAVFGANDRLTTNATIVTETQSQLYEVCEGAVSLVSLLPGKPGKAVSEATVGSAGTGGPDHRLNVQHAVSSDGSRVYWTGTEQGSVHVYVRVGGTETVPVSGAVSAGNARFWIASRDGGKAIFTIGKALYEFDLGTRTAKLVGEGIVGGPLGASEDLSYVYFVSEEALATGATGGQANLYMDHEGAITLIATLALSDASGSDVAEESEIGTDAPTGPARRTVRVTPDGRHIAFFSTASLTGYDNHDVVTGRPDAEVYTYDAESGLLTCVSCNPSGARPAGRGVLGTNGAVIPVASMLPTWANQLYASRALSDDGSRVFFDSYDGLVPADVNGKTDVYEWETPGTGGCTTESAAYFASSHGCVSLISSGESSEDSEFVDASATGDDVFFRTTANLVARDFGLADIYDARVDGGFPPAQTQPAACEGEACQAPPAPPNDATPASSMFEGSGNVTVVPGAHVASKAKPPTRVQKLTRALKACRAQHGKKRKRCEARARKRFGKGAGSSKRSRTSSRRGS